jgi:hypothetical protein
MKPRGRVGDVVPSQASDDELRLLYGADAEVIIELRQSFRERSGCVEDVEGRDADRPAGPPQAQEAAPQNEA